MGLMPKRSRSRQGPPTHFSAGELAVFHEPVTLTEAKRVLGLRGPRIAVLAAQAEADGLLESPGRGPRWRLTAAGRAHVEAWTLAAG